MKEPLHLIIKEYQELRQDLLEEVEATIIIMEVAQEVATLVRLQHQVVPPPIVLTQVQVQVQMQVQVQVLAQVQVTIAALETAPRWLARNVREGSHFYAEESLYFYA